MGEFSLNLTVIIKPNLQTHGKKALLIAWILSFMLFMFLSVYSVFFLFFPWAEHEIQEALNPVSWGDQIGLIKVIYNLLPTVEV